MALIGFQKTIGANLRNGIVLPVGTAFCRPTNLSPGWRRARIALIMSLTNLADVNATPIAETYGGPSEAQVMHIGLSSANLLPGSAGMQFLGLSQALSTLHYLTFATSMWGVGYSTGSLATRMYCTHANGGLVTRGTNYAESSMTHTDPTAQTTCAFSWCLDIDIGTAGSLSINVKAIHNLSPVATSATDAQVQLNSILTYSLAASTDVTPSAATGGWWSGSVDSGCTNLFIRFPWLNNRMRLLGVQVLQLR